MVFWLLLLPSFASADGFGALRGLVCDAIKRAQSPAMVLNHDSIVLDTNLIPQKQLVKWLQHTTHRPDIRVTNRGRREMFVINERLEQLRQKNANTHGITFKGSYFGFPEDPRAAEIRDKIRSTLEQNNVGGKFGFGDQEIVTEIFCAKTVDGAPVFATADKGIFIALFKLTPMAQAVPEEKIIKRYYPRGFEVTIEGRTIRVIPVPGKVLSEPEYSTPVLGTPEMYYRRSSLKSAD